MAHIVHRVSYPVVDGGEARRVTERFPDTKEGRQRAAQLAKRPEGRRFYDVQYRDGDKGRSESFARERDARTRASEIEAGQARGTFVDPRRGRVILKTYAEQWLANRTGLAERTTELYRYLLDKHVLPTFGSSHLSALTPSAIRAWHAKLARAHNSTAAKAYRLLSTILRTAVADELIVRSPCTVKGAGIETAAERPIATIAEIEALADAMPDNLRIAILLAAWCQLRRGELLGLRRRDVDLERGTISVAVTRVVTMKGRTVAKEPKTAAGRRTVAIPPPVVPTLRRHLSKYVSTEPDTRLVPSYVLLRDNWGRAREEIGRPDLRLHDLRHTGLTLAAATGATVAELMHRAGHSSPAAALRYQHATIDRDRDLAASLGKLAKAPHDNGRIVAGKGAGKRVTRAAKKRT